MTNNTSPLDTQKLLDFLHRGGQYAYIWTLHDKKSAWYRIGESHPLPQGGSDVYFGVHPCTQIPSTNSTGKPAATGMVRAQLPYIAAINALFSDFDAKCFGDDKTVTLSHINELPLPPSVIIDSGGGYHCYWLLDKTFHLDSQPTRDRAVRIQKAWVAYVQGDEGAKDLARILRLPGMLNTKYQPTRQVGFVKFDLSCLYEFEDLEALALGTLADIARTDALEQSSKVNHVITMEIDQVRSLLSRLSIDRCNAYKGWIEVGMALSELGGDGLLLWDEWSKHSTKYRPGECADKWRSFIPGHGLNIGSLVFWADQDSPLSTTVPSLVTSTVSASAPPSAPNPTDDELAEEWLAKYTGTVYGLGQFWRFDGGYYRPLADMVVKQEVLQVLQGAKTRRIKPTDRLVKSVVSLAAYKALVSDDQWNSNPDILVCRNGTLEIPTRTLRPHDQNDYQTSAVPYDYDPDEKAPTFSGALSRLGVDVSSFIMEFAGYSLTTDTKYEIAVWFHGPSGCGKSTIITGFQAMLGFPFDEKNRKQAQSGRVGILGLGEIERNRFALTNILGKTLLISTEQPVTFAQSTHILNAIISGEPITVDRKFREPVEIVPRAKLFWAMNEIPRIGDAGNGLFRRVKVVAFPALNGEPDPSIKKMIKLEGAGILNMALDGLDRLRERGHFEIPSDVRAASEEYQTINDVPKLFIADCCQTGPDYRVQSALLYEDYRLWCEKNGHKPQSSTSIAGDWKRLGFTQKAIVGRVYWTGIGLLEKQALGI